MYSKYNGVRLPSPPAYDSKTYRFAVVAVDKVGMYYFNVYDSEPYYQEGWLRFTQDGNGLFWTYDPESGSNSWNGPFDTTYTATATRTAPLWANFNVMNQNGDIWLMGSEPDPDYHKASFQKGLALGLVINTYGKPDPSVITGISYVVGTPVEFTILASAWDGTHCVIKAVGYQVGDNGLYIGLPAGDISINAQRVIEAAITLPQYTFTKADAEKNRAAYTTLTVSSIEAPTEDIKIAVFGLEEVAELVMITDPAVAGVTVPVTGQKRVTEIDCDQFTGTITWNPDDSTFKASTKYTATITLKPKPGYTLSGVASNFFTVEGASSDSNNADSGVVTAVFPTTAAG